MANNILDLMGYVQQQGNVGQARGQQQFTQRLGGQIVRGDPAAYEQLAAQNPEAAKQYQQAGDAQTKRLEGAIDYIEQAKKLGNPQAVEAAYQQVRPYLARFGQEPPATFAEAEPKFNEAKMRIAMAKAGQQQQGQDPTGYREAHMKAVAAGYQPGSADYQRAMRVSLGTEAGLARTQPKVIEVDIGGVPTTLTYDPGTDSFRRGVVGEGPRSPQGVPAQGGVAPASNASSMPRMGDDQIMAYANKMSQAGLPQDQIEAWIRNQQSMPQGVSATGEPAPLPTIGQPAAGVPIIGRTKEAESAAVEAAKQGAQLQFLPEQERIKRESATQQAIDIETGKNDAERDKAGATKAPQLQNVERGLDRIDQALSALEIGTVGDTGPIDQYYQRFTPEGQELEAAIGAIQNDMLALTRVPGVGSQSDLEAKIANMKYPALSNDPGVNRRNLQQLRQFTRDLGESMGRSAPQPQNRRSSDIDALLDKYR